MQPCRANRRYPIFLGVGIFLLFAVMWPKVMWAAPRRVQRLTAADFRLHLPKSAEMLDQIAVTTRQPYDPYGRKFLFSQLFDDCKFFLSKPESYALVGGVTAMPIIFRSNFATEDPEFTEMWGSSQFADDFFESGEYYGQAVYHMAAAVLLYDFGRVKSHPNLRSFGSDLFRAHMINGVITLSMKGIVHRKRPNGGPYSYPSGHTSSAFTTAGVVYEHFGKYYGIPALALATYVGFSRLQENKHYFSDVVAGAIIGSYVGFRIVRKPEDEKSLEVSPSISYGAPGVALTYSF